MEIKTSTGANLYAILENPCGPILQVHWNILRSRARLSYSPSFLIPVPQTFPPWQVHIGAEITTSFPDSRFSMSHIQKQLWVSRFLLFPSIYHTIFLSRAASCARNLSFPSMRSESHSAALDKIAHLLVAADIPSGISSIRASKPSLI